MLWVLAAGVLGFLIPAVCVGRFRIQRSWFLVPYVLLAGGFSIGYLVWSRIDLAAHSTRNWQWGLVSALLIGALMVRNVLSQPQSERAQGAAVAVQIAWWGVVYGALDGLFLSVVPVLAALTAMGALTWEPTWFSRAIERLVAMAASLWVTAAYHAGYPEFRGRGLLLAMLGNGIMSFAYLLTGSPISAIVPHVAMHVASVVHGPESTVQLPPHEASAGENV
jgi:hypothetical protein